MPPAIVVWVLRAGVILLAGLAMTVTLTPTGLAPGRWPSPDLVFVLIAMMMVRRPEAVPLGLVLPLSLASDLLRGAPLGIASLVLIAAAELLAPMRERMARAGFLLEWMVVALMFLATLAAQLLALRLTFLPWPGLSTTLAYAAGTILAYPVLRLAAGAVLPLGRRTAEETP